ALAVDRHNPMRWIEPKCGPQCRHEGRKSLGQIGGIEQPEQPAEGIVAWRSVRQVDNLAQLFLVRFREFGSLRRALGPAQRRCQCQKQDAPNRVACIDVARIAYFSQNGNEGLHGSPQAKRKPQQNPSNIDPQESFYSSAIPLPGGGGSARSLRALARRAPGWGDPSVKQYRAARRHRWSMQVF